MMNPKTPMPLANNDKNSSKNSGSTEKEESTVAKKSLRDHKNPVVRAFARAGYIMWIVLIGLGGLLAFLITLTAI